MFPTKQNKPMATKVEKDCRKEPKLHQVAKCRKTEAQSGASSQFMIMIQAAL